MDSIRSVEIERGVVLFTKPAHPGRVKTRLIGHLSAEQACELHSAFLEDLSRRLTAGDFDLRIAWAVASREPLPPFAVPGFRQEGNDLGERLYHGLRHVAERHRSVLAIGSDHPELPLGLVHDAFGELEKGVDVVVGPAEDGGYYLIGVRADRLVPELFRDIPWSSADVLSSTLMRCEAVGLSVRTLPVGSDVDTPQDLARLRAALRSTDLDCPHTRRLLESWARGREEASTV